MGKEISTPPPRGSSLPDYIAGKLVYEDTESADNMRYVVYDGRTRQRFVSWNAAVQWCVRQSLQYDDMFVYDLMTQYHRLLSTSSHLDKLAEQCSVEDKLLLEQLAVNTRKIADYLDTFVSQIIKSKEYERNEGNQGADR